MLENHINTSLMLIPRSGGWEVTYYILNASLIEFLEEGLENGKEKSYLGDALEEFALESVAQIFGTGDLKPSEYENAFNITSVAAQKGFGPSMYDTFLCLAKDRGIIPARKNIRGLTKSATRVWDYYYNYRKDEVSYRPIENKDILYYPGKLAPIDHVFCNKNLSVDYKDAIAEHKKNIKIIQKYVGAKNMSTARFNTAIHNLATAFFREKYQNAD